MVQAEIIADVKSGAITLFHRRIVLENTTKTSLRPAILGWNMEVYELVGKLLDKPPLGPPNEIINFTAEYEISVDLNNVYKTDITIDSKRFLVKASAKGMRIALHEDIVNFINNFFKEE